MHSVRILLTGGRAPATLDLARQCTRAGYAVFVAESIPVHLCRYSSCVQKCYLVPAPNRETDAYIDALIAIVERERIDLLLPTCEEIFFVAQGLERLRQHCRVCVAPLEQMKRLHSKWEFIQRVSSYGLQVPHTVLLTSLTDLRQFMEATASPFALKPVFSRFASQVIMSDEIQSIAQLEAKLHISESHPWLAQQRISGQGFSSYSIAHAGKLVAHVVYPENFMAGRGACITFQPVEQPQIDRWVQRFVAAEEFTGQIAFDFIVTPAGEVFPLECNPRATSGIHLFQQVDRLPDSFFLRSDEIEDVLRPQPRTRKMIALAMLVYGLPSVRSMRRLKEWLRLFLTSQDVIYDRRDMLPFLLQPRLVWYNWRRSRKLHISMLEFSTYDIEWNGD